MKEKVEKAVTRAYLQSMNKGQIENFPMTDRKMVDTARSTASQLKRLSDSVFEVKADYENHIITIRRES